MARLVPEVSSEVALYLEGRVGPLVERQAEELDDVHLCQPYVEQSPVHLCRRRVEIGQAPARVPEPREPLVATRRPDELEGLDRSGHR